MLGSEKKRVVVLLSKASNGSVGINLLYVVKQWSFII